MSTPVISIFANQDPMDIGTDTNDRAVFAVNYTYKVRGSSSFMSDIISYLVANGVGTAGTNIFEGSKAVLPSAQDVDPVILLVRTGGFTPDAAIDKTSVINQGTFQVTTRDLDTVDAESKAFEILNLLNQMVNVTIP